MLRHSPSRPVQVEYSRDNQSYMQVMLSFFVIALVLTATVAGVRMFNWSRRNVRTMTESSIDLGTIFRFAVFLVGSFGAVYF